MRRGKAKRELAGGSQWTRNAFEAFEIGTVGAQVKMTILEDDMSLEMTFPPATARWLAEQLLDAVRRAEA